jgi:nitroreductase
VVEFTEVIKRRRMVRAFKDEPLAAGITERLLRAANRAPSAGFSQGYAFLVLEGKDQCAPLWELVREADASEGATGDADPGFIAPLSRAPLVIVLLACKDIYLERYAEPGKGWTDRDESRWPVPYWYVDTGFTALLTLLAAVDEGLGAVLFGIAPESMTGFRAEYDVPAEWTPIGAIAIGHPDPDSEPVYSARASDRKTLEQLVHRGHW